MLMTMRPLCQLTRRIDGTMVLLMLIVIGNGHASAVALEAVSRDALVNDFVIVIVVWDFDFARELHVVVLPCLC